MSLFIRSLPSQYSIPTASKNIGSILSGKNAVRAKLVLLWTAFFHYWHVYMLLCWFISISMWTRAEQATSEKPYSIHTTMKYSQNTYSHSLTPFLSFSLWGRNTGWKKTQIYHIRNTWNEMKMSFLVKNRAPETIDVEKFPIFCFRPENELPWPRLAGWIRTNYIKQTFQSIQTISPVALIATHFNILLSLYRSHYI